MLFWERRDNSKKDCDMINKQIWRDLTSSTAWEDIMSMGERKSHSIGMVTLLEYRHNLIDSR